MLLWYTRFHRSGCGDVCLRLWAFGTNVILCWNTGVELSYTTQTLDEWLSRLGLWENNMLLCSAHFLSVKSSKRSIPSRLRDCIFCLRGKLKLLETERKEEKKWNLCVRHLFVAISIDDIYTKSSDIWSEEVQNELQNRVQMVQRMEPYFWLCCVFMRNVLSWSQVSSQHPDRCSYKQLLLYSLRKCDTSTCCWRTVCDFLSNTLFRLSSIKLMACGPNMVHHHYFCGPPDARLKDVVCQIFVDVLTLT